jgi:hypothetical protein
LENTISISKCHNKLGLNNRKESETCRQHGKLDQTHLQIFGQFGFFPSGESRYYLEGEGLGGQGEPVGIAVSLGEAAD